MAVQTSLYTLHIQLEPLQFDPPIWRRIVSVWPTHLPGSSS